MSTKSRTVLPRCVARTRDGSQCGRRVADGSNPPVCHLHNGSPPPAIIPDDVDEMKILRKLTRDSNPQVRLRAVDLLISLKQKQEKGCRQCTDRAAKEAATEDMLHRLTIEQRTRLRELIAEVNAIKAAALMQIPTWDAERQCYLDESPPPMACTAPPAVSPAPAIADAPACSVPPPSDVPPVPRELPRELWEAAGLIVLDDGTVTDALGDEEPQRILSGVVSFAEAAAREEASKRELSAIGARPSTWHGQPDCKRPYSD